MAKPWDITGDDIALWSQRFEASSVLPDLVRRLLLATAPLSSLSTSAHAGTRLRGWDIIVRASTDSAFWPAGVSGWELTVDDAKGKLKKDFDKRAGDPAPLIARETTYLAVSARRISDKARWVADRNAASIWREVRLLDADDLAAWLTRAPAVARWFASRIGRPVDDLDDLDTFLDAFCRRTRPTLPRDIILLGQDRQQLAENVRAWTRANRPRAHASEPLRIHGDTWEEAAVFAAAALALDTSPEGEQIRARTIVARSEAALREVLRVDQAQPLIAIAAFAGATASVGPIVLPLEGPLPRTALDVLRLPSTPYQRIAEVLEKAGMPEREAGRIAFQSGGKLGTLQRLLGYVELPRWAQGLPPLPLTAMLLAGSFELGNTEDRDVLEVLGANADEVERLCERLCVGPDAPTIKEQGRNFRMVWRWRSLEDAWRTLAGQIPAASLRGFDEAIRLILAERDPKLDLAPEQRMAAALYGKTLRASGALREGLVRSLVYLSLNDAALEPLHGAGRGSRLAEIAVRELLPTAWTSWASLSNLLPLLAEAAPERFLKCLEASLSEGHAGAAHLLAEEVMFGDSPHTGLLWALETLGWDERLFPQVAAALAKLAQFDATLERPGRMTNRPRASLAGLLGFLPQTCASAKARIHEMARRLEETPEIGSRLLVEEISSLGQMTMAHQAHQPELLPINIPGREKLLERANREFSGIATAHLKMALDHAGHDAERWAYFVKETRRSSPDVERKLLDRLEAVRPNINDERADLWAAIRHVLHRSRPNEIAEPGTESQASPPREAHQRWQRLYEGLEPEDLALRYAWLFVRPVKLPDGFQAHAGIEAEGQAIGKRQREAIEAIGPRPERLQILCLLGAKVKEDGALGWTLGSVSFAQELEPHLIDASPPESLAPQVPTYLAQRRQAEGPAWLEEKLRALLPQGRTEEIKKTLRLFRGSPEIWGIAEALGQEVWRSYWQDLEYVSGEHATEEWERALKNLLAAGNVAGALLNAESAKENISSDTIAEALKALLANPNHVMLADDQHISWVLEQLMDRLEASPDVETRYAPLLADVEFLYALRTFEPNRPMRRLSAAFASNPDLFVELVTKRYRPHGEPRPELSEAEQEEVEKHALVAHRVLDSWTGYPGQGLPAEEREDVLHAWSLQVSRALGAVRRAETGGSEVAKVLARAPAAADGLWPCLAARRLLESNEFPVLSSRLITAERNLRNARMRPVSGDRERATASSFRDAAKALRSASPRTAIMLDGLADAYEQDAARHDAAERARLREEGGEPHELNPPPRGRTESPKPREWTAGLVHITSLEVTDFANIRQLKIDLEPNEGRGQWLVLLGDNGAGKSTILRALAMALEGTNVAQAALGIYPAPLIRVGADAARCVVTCGDATFSLVINHDETHEAATCEPTNGPRRPVFAYGCRRGSALGGNEATDLTSAFSDVATLFSESASLFPARSWLQRLKAQAREQPEAYEPIFQTVLEKLCRLLDVERLDVMADEVWVIAERLGGRVPLAALSDGYLTTLGWLVDLIARWIHWAEQKQENLAGDFFQRMEGLVLVDEIDLHLHPRWQHGIVKALKETFPRLSFVVTTHNPLTLVGAEKGEIVVLREKSDGKGGPKALQLNLPPGIHPDRILTGAWFGLPYTVDDETMALVEEHQQMLLRGVPPEAPERRALEEKLAKRYGTYGDTSLDRMALDVAAELMAEQRPQTPEDRKALRESLREAVKKRLEASRREATPQR